MDKFDMDKFDIATDLEMFNRTIEGLIETQAQMGMCSDYDQRSIYMDLNSYILEKLHNDIKEYALSIYQDNQEERKQMKNNILDLNYDKVIYIVFDENFESGSSIHICKEDETVVVTGDPDLMYERFYNLRLSLLRESSYVSTADMLMNTTRLKNISLVQDKIIITFDNDSTSTVSFDDLERAKEEFINLQNILDTPHRKVELAS